MKKSQDDAPRHRLWPMGKNHGQNSQDQLVWQLPHSHRWSQEDPIADSKYYLSSWDPDASTSTQLPPNNRPCRTITNVQSDNNPQAAHMIKQFYLPNLLAPSFPQAMAAPSTFMVPATWRARKGTRCQERDHQPHISSHLCQYWLQRIFHQQHFVCSPFQWYWSSS